MRPPSYADAYQVLLLQAADQGRGPVLFGDSLQRVRAALQPFMVGKKFPSVYFEHPLLGEPFLDVTVLYNALDAGTRIASDAVAGTEGLLDWFAALDNDGSVSFGFELDTKETRPSAAGVHFQPRIQTELVRPFCEVVGEPERADLYLNLAERMPKGWPLSFFGMFRGRPQSPLRVCGYLGKPEQEACTEDPRHLSAVFDQIGFTAYDEAMISQIQQLMRVAPTGVDFQLDVFPDGSLGSVFALDIQFMIQRPDLVYASFDDGPGSQVMSLLEEWGAADERWRTAPNMAFAQALPVELENGERGAYGLSLIPQWVKARWKNGVLQPSKLYHLGGYAPL